MSQKATEPLNGLGISCNPIEETIEKLMTGDLKNNKHGIINILLSERSRPVLADPSWETTFDIIFKDWIPLMLFRLHFTVYLIFISILIQDVYVFSLWYKYVVYFYKRVRCNPSNIQAIRSLIWSLSLSLSPEGKGGNGGSPNFFSDILYIEEIRCLWGQLECVILHSLQLGDQKTPLLSFLSLSLSHTHTQTARYPRSLYKRRATENPET